MECDQKVLFKIILVHNIVELILFHCQILGQEYIINGDEEMAKEALAL